METNILEKAKLHMLAVSKQGELETSYLPGHIGEVERWARIMLDQHPEADREVALLGVWLHDIGVAIKGGNDDHSVRSEAEARKFLSTLGLSSSKIEKVAHCVRAHRCKDVKPETIEAKIVAAADSASHLTDYVYILFTQKGDKRLAEEKLERDYRDVKLVDGLQEQLTPLYEAWQKLLAAFPER